ncbi:MAG: hypothetical protein WDM86_07310 [Rhizomicrobium sp.]
MNDLIRVALGLAGVAANTFGLWIGAHADVLPVGGGTIACRADGATTGNTPTGGTRIQMIDNDTVTVGGWGE